MPLLKWRCPACGRKQRVFLSTGKPALDVVSCPDCKLPMERETGVTTTVVETRDNGIMPRKVEQIRDIQELRHDHAQQQDTKEPGIV